MPHGQNTARTREATHCTWRTKVAGDTAFFHLYDEEDALCGARPASLAEPQGPQERVQWHTVEQLSEVAPMVQILDDPVPQTVEQLVDVPKIIDILVLEQVIEVPKIFSQDSIPQRVVLQGPQLVERLVGVPVPSFRHCVIAGTLPEVVLAGSETLLATSGASALGWVGSTGGCRAPPRRAPRAVNKYWARLGRARLPDVGRPCHCAAPVPAAHPVRERGGASDSVHRQRGGLLQLSVVRQIRCLQCKLCRKPEISQVQFLGPLLTRQLTFQRRVRGPDSAENFWEVPFSAWVWTSL